MLASDLQVSLPLVTRATTALEAAHVIARERLSGLVVADESGIPVAVASSADVLRLMVPGYVMDDMALAGVLDEAGVDEVWARLHKRTIGELLDDDAANVRDITCIDADANLIEVAARMVDARAEIAVVGTPAPEARFITLPSVMAAILKACGKWETKA